MDLVIFIILSSLAAWLLNRWRTRAYVRVACQVPSNKLHTWLGWGPIFDSNTIQTYLWNNAEKYGTDCVFWSGPFSFFLPSTPETVEDILTSKHCINKPSLIYSGLESVIDKGLVTNSNPDWSRHRKVFNKVFSNKHLYTFTPIFRKEVSHILNCIEESVKSGKSNDLLALFRNLTTTTAFQTIVKRKIVRSSVLDEMVFSLNCVLSYGADLCFNQPLRVKVIRYLAEITSYRKAKVWLENIHKFTNESLAAAAEKKDGNDPAYSYLADIIAPVDYALTAHEQNVLTANEMRGNMKHLIFGAIETTSTTIFSVICMLAMHHECQERVYEEVAKWAPDNGKNNDNDQITFEQVNQLVYLDMIINETMRLFPTVPAIFRTVSHENLKLSKGGQILPVGQLICIDIYGLHRNKDIWGPNADRFNPENFSPENTKQRHPYAFIPFTKGKRFCIGYRYAMLSMKIALAELIRNFHFDTDFKFEDMKIVNHISLKIVEEPEIKIKRRIPKAFETTAS